MSNLTTERVLFAEAAGSASLERAIRERSIRQVDTFGRLATPGMTLVRQPEQKPSLYPRCEDCGQRISANKRWCRTCNQVHLLELGEQITTQDLLDAVLRRSADPEKALDALRPYLKFDPKPLR